MNRLRELRKEITFQSLSHELARQGIQMSADSLAKYERGEREPKLETWEKLAAYFNVTPQYLVGWSDER
ncbi:helix-turn-helix transcriptional regulator [Leuconostoc citreum]|uniref:helix-turn-helix domain-containing protein n=1 Tax=Leuconostoc citreum TaxID=33964 RepID=UPI001887B6E3|nr:helix-turn-helix transcriptional regulator [Leuconostoc citreum]QOY98367.1 helix-turn-helix transcriptional regulator [Leuconostoc citreum]